MKTSFSEYIALSQIILYFITLFYTIIYVPVSSLSLDKQKPYCLPNPLHSLLLLWSGFSHLNLDSVDLRS